MCENITKKINKTPLRNSNSANKPFRSPLTVVTPALNRDSSKNEIRQSPIASSKTCKRRNLAKESLECSIKKRRIDERIEESEKENEIVSQCDLVALKKRVCSKKQEIQNLERRLHYIGKHKKEELTNKIKNWRSALIEALLRLSKMLNERASECVTMDRIFTMLEISQKTIKLTDDEREELGLSENQ